MNIPVIDVVQEVVCFCDVPYDFKNEKGERVSGKTRKVCFREYKDGNLSGLYISKATPGFQAAVNKRGMLTYDRNGKINGFVPVEG